MAAPLLDPAAAAALANQAIEYKKHVLCDVVAQHVRDKVSVPSLTEFYKTVAKTLSNDHGITMGHAHVQREYNRLRAWAVANRTGSDGDERKYVKKVLRRKGRQESAAAKAGEEEKEEEEEDKDEEEGEEEEDTPLNMGNFTGGLPSAPAGQASVQPPPAPAPAPAPFSLPVRPKET